jgi:hypothetical protein
MKKLEHLKQEVIEEGRGHPFVESVVWMLRQRYQALHELLESHTISGQPEAAIYSTGGRAAEVNFLIALITKTEGQAE